MKKAILIGRMLGPAATNILRCAWHRKKVLSYNLPGIV